MGKHRKTQHFRRMVIGAVAVGTVGVPSVALACTNWPSGTTDQSAAATGTTPLALADTPAPTDPATAAAGETAIPQQPGTSWAIPKQRAHHPHPRHHSKAPSAPLTTAAPTASQAAAAQPGGTPPAAAPAQSDAPAAAPTASSTPAAATPSATTASGVTAQIVQLVNAERAKAGCRPLTLDAKLTKAAQAHSADMAAHQNMSHTGSDGSDPGTRITQAGYAWSAYGENVAYGYSTAAEVMAGWMSSPGHRANILNCGYQEIGVGLAQPGSYWTQDFGTAR
ncbi:CAP domain-containing protein [Streptomyces sp. SID8366]|uniref:CAP domain-containing protein n=1 Tax=unclassified Streptomyces TaxID=2593676 RepID=UPI000DB9D150|nr:CAP domain-containing protein [Streptomyces sp. PsTaAH-130]MYU05318.1 CAP domain-containing protein [Streptomyces sp. SID8366]RAJ66199.1 uncharacterized protein YkwD [Streptomyces sp. PsTaAH-130]